MDKLITINKELIHYGDQDVFSDKNFPSGKTAIKDLISLMLVYGSNTACDILLAEIEGPIKVQNYIERLGVNKMKIINTEKEIQSDDATKYQNWATTNEMIKLLTFVFNKKSLSNKSYKFLWDKMKETTTGVDRLKKMLPNDAVIAHRTGTANNAYNDVGIITLPNGNHLAIAVFISDAKDYQQTCNEVIAKIGKLSWEYYSLK